MSILLDSDTRVVVQGITNDQAGRDVRYGKQYGTNVVAGVRPGRAGEEIEGVPTFDTMAQAVEETNAELAVGYLPPGVGKEGVFEALDTDIDTYLLVTEEVPQQEALQMARRADQKGVTLIGPGSNGLSSAGKAKIGGHGGDNPERVFDVGSVGIASRSGGLATETAWLLKNHGIGVSTVVSIGGRPFIGSTLPDIALKFEDDDQTDVLVICGEAGTIQEETLAERLSKGDIKMPVVSLIGGEILEYLPQGVSFGHTGAVINEEQGKPSVKKDRLQQAGARIADTPDDIPPLVSQVLDNNV